MISGIDGHGSCPTNLAKYPKSPRSMNVGRDLQWLGHDCQCQVRQHHESESMTLKYPPASGVDSKTRPKKKKKVHVLSPDKLSACRQPTYQRYAYFCMYMYVRGWPLGAKGVIRIIGRCLSHSAIVTGQSKIEPDWRLFCPPPSMMPRRSVKSSITVCHKKSPNAIYLKPRATPHP